MNTNFKCKNLQVGGGGRNFRTDANLRIFASVQCELTNWALF